MGRMSERDQHRAETAPHAQGRASATPATHRKPGPATVRMPPAEPPTFGQVLADHYRQVLWVVLGVMLALIWGARAVLVENSVGERASGFAAVCGGLLLLASYVLRFRSEPLDHAWWSESRARMAARFVLAHTWRIYYIVILVAGVGYWLSRFWA